MFKAFWFSALLNLSGSETKTSTFDLQQVIPNKPWGGRLFSFCFVLFLFLFVLFLFCFCFVFVFFLVSFCKILIIKSPLSLTPRKPCLHLRGTASFSFPLSVSDVESLEMTFKITCKKCGKNVGGEEISQFKGLDG